jgi:tetratricopeptide (TPR) repeat protein
MITRKEIESLSPDLLHSGDKLAEVEEEILSIAVIDDRDDLLYTLTERLIEEGLLEQAEKTARLVQEQLIEKTWLLGNIALRLGGKGRTEQAIRLLREALPTARTSGVEWQQAESITRIARRFYALEERETAVELLREAAGIAQRGEAQCSAVGNVQDARDSASTLDEIASTLAEIGEWGRAKEVASSIQESYIRDRCLNRLESRPFISPYAV